MSFCVWQDAPMTVAPITDDMSVKDFGDVSDDDGLVIARRSPAPLSTASHTSPLHPPPPSYRISLICLVMMVWYRHAYAPPLRPPPHPLPSHPHTHRHCP